MSQSLDFTFQSYARTDDGSHADTRQFVPHVGQLPAGRKLYVKLMTSCVTDCGRGVCSRRSFSYVA